MITRIERNSFIQSRYDELMHIGKHGHYETMFQVFDELLTEVLKDRGDR